MSQPPTNEAPKDRGDGPSQGSGTPPPAAGASYTFFDGRPAWMNAIMIFCAFMTFIYMPFDLFFKPVAEDQEVWFGFMLTGWAAKATEPLHWAIYAAGAWGFWKMRPWMWPWAAAYVAQVAIGMLVWSLIYPPNFLWSIVGVVAFGAFGYLALVLWRARGTFQPETAA